MAIRVKNSDGRLLCSNEKSRQVALLSPEEANFQDSRGQFIWNDAWECTPDDIDVPLADEDIDFLEKYMPQS